MEILRSKIHAIWVFVVFATALSLVAAGQSTDQNYPTPITTNEINGTIKARDIGDSRLTRFYYAFDGGQGDIFINVVAKNFSGDIDIFTADTLNPLTKMVFQPDGGLSETGRLVYLRKAARLILRVEGRSPNDDPATFRIKFAGSFVALAGQTPDEAPPVARSESVAEGEVRVNSVGTIMEVRPKLPTAKPTPTSKESVSVRNEDEIETKTKPDSSVDESASNKTGSKTKPDTVFEDDAAKVIVNPVRKPSAKRPPNPKTVTKATKPVAKTVKPPEIVKEKTPNPLENIRLVIQLKDGNVIQRPMSEVVKFSVDKGVLVVVAKNGKIVRYSILDVAKVTIE